MRPRSLCSESRPQRRSHRTPRVDVATFSGVLKAGEWPALAPASALLPLAKGNYPRLAGCSREASWNFQLAGDPMGFNRL